MNLMIHSLTMAYECLWDLVVDLTSLKPLGLAPFYTCFDYVCMLDVAGIFDLVKPFLPILSWTR